MSIRLMLDLWRINPPITSTQKLVLQCLAFYTKDEEGYCYPSYSQIADKCSFTRAAVVRAIKELCFTGLLVKESSKVSVDGNSFESNKYRIVLDGGIRGIPGVVYDVYQGGIPRTPHYLINDLIINPKENNKKKDEPEMPRSEKISSSVLRNNAKLVIDFLRLKTGRNYQYVETTMKLIIQRLREGITVEQCKQVIARKHMEWGHKPEMEKYLRPSTLFNKSNFYDKYLPELVTEEERKKIMKKIDDK